MTPWGKFLRETVLRARTITEAAGLIGVSQGFLSGCIHGHSQVPLDQITAWADALRLDGDTRRRFLDLAALTQIRDLDIQRRIAAALVQASSISQRLADAEELQRRLDDVCRILKPAHDRRVAEGGERFNAESQS